MKIATSEVEAFDSMTGTTRFVPVYLSVERAGDNDSV